jgi:hypothetical protein
MIGCISAVRAEGHVVKWRVGNGLRWGQSDTSHDRGRMWSSRPAVATVVTCVHLVMVSSRLSRGVTWRGRIRPMDRPIVATVVMLTMVNSGVYTSVSRGQGTTKAALLQAAVV